MVMVIRRWIVPAESARWGQRALPWPPLYRMVQTGWRAKARRRLARSPAQRGIWDKTRPVRHLSVARRIWSTWFCFP